MSLSAIIGENGIINNALEASIMSRFSKYDEELAMATVEDSGVYASGDKIENYIPSIEDKDLEKFVIVKSKLLYIGIDELETKIANRLGLGGGTTQDSSDRQATIDEIKSIVDGVIDESEENKEKIPVDDNDKLDELEKLQKEGKTQYTNSEDGLIGVRLFDRKGANLTKGTWNILIEYDSSNKEVDRYGSGYYWLQKGTSYTINGETLDFKNDYVIDYSKGEYILLSGRAVNWNVNATLGVAENVVLNLDAMSFESGRWEETEEKDSSYQTNFYNFMVKDGSGSEFYSGAQKTGDVEYDPVEKALRMNESEDNEYGEGGYLKVTNSKNSDSIDFSKGFTLELFCRTNRLSYKDRQGRQVDTGLFTRAKSLYSDFINGIRLNISDNNFWLKLSAPQWGLDMSKNDVLTSKSENVSIGYDSATAIKHNLLEEYVKRNEQFYLTVVYNASNIIKDENGDLIRNFLYINGERISSGYFMYDWYDKGLGVWNGDGFDCFLGVVTAGTSDKQGFLKGDIYAVRLYSAGLNEEEVKLNYEKTVKYRNSFKSETIE